MAGTSRPGIGYFSGFIIACFLMIKICEGQTCAPHEFQCANKECIHFGGRCDRRKTCSDGSDEEACPTAPMTTPSLPPHYRPCYEGSFQCDNGRCIYKHWRCDGQDDCGDVSDETDCSKDEKKTVGSLEMNTESIIGISIALVALVLLIGGILAFVLYYKRKLCHTRARQRRQAHVTDLLEQMPGLPYNFPREALLREPPPRYTSQQDLSSAHVNGGYNDDEVTRPPPCYSSNPDLRGTGLPMVHVLEPPPCYSSYQHVGVMETNLMENSVQSQNNMSSDSDNIQGIEVIERCLNERKRENARDACKTNTIAGSGPTGKYLGDDLKNEMKLLRKQKGMSVSDTNIVQAVMQNYDVIESGKCNKEGTAAELSNAQGGSMTQSKIITLSAYIEDSAHPTILAKWRDHISPRSNSSQPLSRRFSSSCSNIVDSNDKSKVVPQMLTLEVSADMRKMTGIQDNCGDQARDNNRASFPQTTTDERQTNINSEDKAMMESGQAEPEKNCTPSKVFDKTPSISTRSGLKAREGLYSSERMLSSSDHAAGSAQYNQEVNVSEGLTNPLDRHRSRSLPMLNSATDGVMSLEYDDRSFQC